ncbi:MAG: GNAT family N-acetyltransferase [Bacteroidales bacterium]|nr:GNAT family N-acetyltransferase [Candidatus Scybalousia scybalohippi]
MKEFDFKIAEKLYIESFPEDERRSLSSVYSLLDSPIFEFIPIKEDNNFLGFANIWDFPEFVYIEHFAIMPNMRNNGIGSRFLKTLQERKNKPIVLEVEKPDNDLAKRRIGFYQRMGFHLLKDYYLQPPYTQESQSVEMKIMVFSPKEENEICFQKIKDTLYKFVYKVK